MPPSQSLSLRPGADAGPGWVRPVALVAAAAWLEGVLRVATGSPLVDASVVVPLLFAVTAGLVLHLVSGFFGRVGRSTVVALGLTGLTLGYAAQVVYFQVFRTFSTVYSAANAGQVAEFAPDIAATVSANGPLLALLVLPPVLVLPVVSRWAPTPASTWRHRGLVLAVALAAHGAALGLIHLGDREPNSPWDLYYRSSYPVASVEQLGLLTTMRLDATRTLVGFEPAGIDPPPEEEPDVEEPSPSPAPGGPVTPTAEPVDYHTLDIDFARLAANATDSKLTSAHTWFGKRKPTATNDHTGRFAGYNVVLVTAEGYSHLAIDKEVTPTLYRMTHEGVNFTNFYNPLWGVSTSDGEYVATTGLIPKPGVWSLARSSDNALPYTLGNQLAELGYETRAYHNHTYDYYDRHLSHPNLGYTYRGVGNGLKVKKTWPESDVEMVAETVDDFVDSEPFHTYYMTVSGHLRYSFGGNFIARKNRDLVADLPYTEAGRAYLATQIELDRALELLLEELEDAGVADRTLIAVSADHYPYGLTRAEIEDLAGHPVDGNFELHRSSFLLYAPGMVPETVDRPVSSLDILPTLSNLLGLAYDSRLLMGVDAFSDSPPLVIFNNRSFITDKGRFNARTRRFVPAPGAEVPDGYRARVSADIDRRFYFSALVLDADYYAIARPR